MWSYDRGTWQYDLIVCLILAFVFFMPRTFFNTERIDKRILAYSHATLSPGNDKRVVSLAEPDPAPAPAPTTEPGAAEPSRHPPVREQSVEKN